MAGWLMVSMSSRISLYMAAATNSSQDTMLGANSNNVMSTLLAKRALEDHID